MHGKAYTGHGSHYASCTVADCISTPTGALSTPTSKFLATGLQWAADNYMIVNTNKTKEIVFHRSPALHSLPIPLIGIEQVLSVKLLGVTVSHNMKFDEHVKMFGLFVASATIY